MNVCVNVCVCGVVYVCVCVFQTGVEACRAHPVSVCACVCLWVSVCVSVGFFLWG